MKKLLTIACAFFAGSAAALSAIGSFTAFAQTKISLSIPGSYVVTTSTPPGYIISNFYQFALLIGGLLAFAAIVYGGVRYITSGGNPSSQSEAKEWIYSAFLGFALLICAYLILNTINPNLTHLDLPTLTQLSVSNSGGGGAFGGGGGGSTGGAPAGTGCATGQCETLPNCTPSAARSGPGSVNCGGAPEMVDTMQCIQNKDPNFNVSEGYPPTAVQGHIAQCHSNGCCVDTTVPGSSCAGVNALIQAAQQCGASVANEYTNCNGTSYITTTGGNVHINAPKTNGC